MSATLASRQRLLALSDVVLREVARLRQTDARLFIGPFDEARAASLDAKPAALAAALTAGHGFVSALCATAEALVAETRRRCTSG